MNISELTTIMSACPNVRFSAEISTYNSVTPTLKALRGRLENIEVWSDNADGLNLDDDELGNAWKECENLRDLDVHSCTIQMAKAIMAIPRKELQRINVYSWRMEENALKKIMDIFPEGSCIVQEITYSESGFLTIPSLAL